MTLAAPAVAAGQTHPTTRQERHVVLLHGLYSAGQDPFADLFVIQRALEYAGFVVHRVPWPAGFNGLRALMDRNRSFGHDLAEALDAELRGHLLPAAPG